MQTLLFKNSLAIPTYIWLVLLNNIWFKINSNEHSWNMTVSGDEGVLKFI